MPAYNPKLSILMPAYNEEKYIEQALKSLLMQTYKDFEVVVVDDGSTDETENIVKKLISKDYRIKYFKTPHQGIAAVRNFALSKASASHYIAWLDADDYISPLTYQTQIEFLENNPKIDVVGANFNLVFNMLIIKAKEVSKNPNSIQNLSKIRYHCPCLLYRKKVIDEISYFRPFEKYGEDSDFFYRVLEKFNIVNIDSYLYYYRRHNNNITNSRFKVFIMILIAQLSFYARKKIKKDPINGLEKILPKHIFLFLTYPQLWLIFISTVYKYTIGYFRKSAH